MKKILTFLIFLTLHNKNFSADIAFTLYQKDIKPLIEYLNNGNDVNTELCTDPWNASRPPLHCAIIYNFLEAAELCIMRGVNVNWRSHDGCNIFDALWILSEDEILPLLKLLMQHQANINMQGYLNRTPLMNAVNRNQIKVAKLLLENKADIRTIKDNDDKSALGYIESLEMLEIFKNYISAEENMVINYVLR